MTVQIPRPLVTGALAVLVFYGVLGTVHPRGGSNLAVESPGRNRRAGRRKRGPAGPDRQPCGTQPGHDRDRGCGARFGMCHVSRRPPVHDGGSLREGLHVTARFRPIHPDRHLDLLLRERRVNRPRDRYGRLRRAAVGHGFRAPWWAAGIERSEGQRAAAVRR